MSVALRKLRRRSFPRKVRVRRETRGTQQEQRAASTMPPQARQAQLSLKFSLRAPYCSKIRSLLVAVPGTRALWDDGYRKTAGSV